MFDIEQRDDGVARFPTCIGPTVGGGHWGRGEEVAVEFQFTAHAVLLGSKDNPELALPDASNKALAQAIVQSLAQGRVRVLARKYQSGNTGFLLTGRITV